MSSRDEKPHSAGRQVGEGSRRDALVSAALLQWSSRPRLEDSHTALVYAALAMTWLTVLAWQLADRTSVLLQVATILVLTHAAWHLVIVWGLRRLHGRGLAGAEEALLAYRDPGRLNNVDLAGVWLAFLLAVRFSDGFHRALF